MTEVLAVLLIVVILVAVYRSCMPARVATTYIRPTLIWKWHKARKTGCPQARIDRVLEMDEVKELYDMAEIKEVLEYYKKRYPEFTHPFCWYAANRTYTVMENAFMNKIHSFVFYKIQGVVDKNGDPDAMQNPWNCIWLKPNDIGYNEAKVGEDRTDYTILLYSGSEPSGGCIYIMKDLEIDASPKVTYWYPDGWLVDYDGY